MFSSDPLREWLLRRAIAPELAERLRSQALSTLEQLNEAVDDLAEQVDLDDLDRLQAEWEQASQGPSDLARVQALYLDVYQIGGPGSTRTQDMLLDLIAAAQDPASIPFWLQVLGLSRPRETGKESRRKMALSALAFLAIQRNLLAAYDALRQAAHYAQPEVRALAVHYWSRAYRDVRCSLLTKALGELSAHPGQMKRSLASWGW